MSCFIEFLVPENEKTVAQIVDINGEPIKDSKIEKDLHDESAEEDELKVTTRENGKKKKKKCKKKKTKKPKKKKVGEYSEGDESGRAAESDNEEFIAATNSIKRKKKKGSKTETNENTITREKEKKKEKKKKTKKVKEKKGIVTREKRAMTEPISAEGYRNVTEVRAVNFFEVEKGERRSLVRDTLRIFRKRKSEDILPNPPPTPANTPSASPRLNINLAKTDLKPSKDKKEAEKKATRSVRFGFWLNGQDIGISEKVEMPLQDNESLFPVIRISPDKSASVNFGHQPLKYVALIISFPPPPNKYCRQFAHLIQSIDTQGMSSGQSLIRLIGTSGLFGLRYRFRWVRPCIGQLNAIQPSAWRLYCREPRRSGLLTTLTILTSSSPPSAMRKADCLSIWRHVRANWVSFSSCCS